MPDQQVLIVDDDKDLCNMVKLTLEHEGFSVDMAYDGKTGYEYVEKYNYNTVILDIMLPEMDGWEVCHKIRNSINNSKVPIIMLTAKVEEDDKIMGLKLGADDYVIKPFSPRELVARVRALIRRDQDFKDKDKILEKGDLTVDAHSYKVFVKDNEVDLPPKEFELLYLLIKNPERVFTREEILEKIWGFSFAGGTRTVDEHVKRIRKKLEPESGFDSLIQTVWGVGYKFEVKNE
ncbi:response regulator transcription factor [Natranaerobius thermophilus]|uniref:Stage 0 sporulation protein A homolog n=1 Tax=Natranaerobius thermophilus (strain ATCC BAA-1301 / DSM 18059 / JW/NM-WN-LF) TaxID=457570 RepID=B2A1Z8_NATTJ|nr:response regulator transcription factor [Natranaerobius thermophilus]ACB84803.1 two component transcriptional regulator, winged helix family [Natranaerobius thermophilus JW/NM-WN-LF]